MLVVDAFDSNHSTTMYDIFCYFQFRPSLRRRASERARHSSTQLEGTGTDHKIVFGLFERHCALVFTMKVSSFLLLPLLGAAMARNKSRLVRTSSAVIRDASRYETQWSFPETVRACHRRSDDDSHCFADCRAIIATIVKSLCLLSVHHLFHSSKSKKRCDAMNRVRSKCSAPFREIQSHCRDQNSVCIFSLMTTGR
jgi:hypothetical protein